MFFLYPFLHRHLASNAGGVGELAGHNQVHPLTCSSDFFFFFKLIDHLMFFDIY